MTEVAKLTPLEEKRRKQIEEKEQAEVVLDAHVPKPVGYRVLIALPTIEDTFEGGIAKASSTIREETILTMVGVVVDMGDQAYNDKERFPSGPWCKEGDFVIFRANTGTRFKVGNEEYRLMNDDSIEAVIDDPSRLTRA
jgi:co-chaperonin GroES (HSP10)